MKFTQHQPTIRYETSGSAGFDIRAKIPSKYTVSGDECVGEITLHPGARVVVPTGLFLDTSAGQASEALLILPRSGIAVKYGVTVCNAPGLIDPDYDQEIGVILINHGQDPFIIRDGDRVAQGVVIHFNRMGNVGVSEKKREGGFGHSGTV